MKNLFTLILLFAFHPLLQAQLVTTVAGQVEIPGSNDGPVFEANFNNPHGIAIDVNGVVYTADRWSHTIRKISLDGIVTTIAGNPGVSGDVDGVGAEALFHEPWGLCVDAEGFIFVADTRNNKIRKISPDGLVSTLAGSGNFGTSNGFGISATFGNPTGIEVDAVGNIYVADHLTHIIRKIDNSGFVTTLAGQAYQMGDADGQGNQASFSRPYGLSLDLNGDVLVADEWNHKIRRITPAGIVTTIAGTGIVGNDNGNGNASSFNYPWDVAVDSLGNIFVADGYNYTIRKISPNGQTSNYAGEVTVSGASDGIGSAARFSGATAIAFSPWTKELYVGDAYNHLVRKITNLNQGVSLALLNSAGSICEGTTIALSAYPNIFDEYHFYIDNQIVQSGSNSFFETTSLSPGAHSFQVYAASNSSSSTSEEMSITVIAPVEPSITIVGSTEFFEGDSVILFASFGEEYFWSTGEITASITVMETGSYSVEVLDANGCTGISDPIEVQVQSLPTAPEISVEGRTTICQNESSLLASSENENNQWLKDGWAIAGATNYLLSINSPGVYQVQHTSATGFVTISEPVEITTYDAFDLDFKVSNTSGSVQQNFQFEIISNSITSAEWDFGDQTNSTSVNPTHQYQNPDRYTVGLMATNENGCRDTVVKAEYIWVFEEAISGANKNINEACFIPNAFSPNGDGENDIFYIRGKSIEEIDLLIFNQWGELVFESNDQSLGWDGTTQNQKAQIGTYTYLLKFTDLDGNRQMLSGHITLLR